MIRILIVDDSPVFLAAATRVVASLPDFEIVGSFRSGAEALAVLDQSSPDVILADFVMTDIGGLELARDLTRRERRPKVVIMTMSEEPQYRSVALGAGADGFISKSDLFEQLPALLRLVAGR